LSHNSYLFFKKKAYFPHSQATVFIFMIFTSTKVFIQFI